MSAPTIAGEVRAYYSADEGQEGWTFGLTRPRRDGDPRTWLIVPGSEYGATLHATKEAAAADLARRWPALATGPNAYDLYRVRSVWRYRRNWFEILEAVPATCAEHAGQPADTCERCHCANCAKPLTEDPGLVGGDLCGTCQDQADLNG